MRRNGIIGLALAAILFCLGAPSPASAHQPGPAPRGVDEIIDLTLPVQHGPLVVRPDLRHLANHGARPVKVVVRLTHRPGSPRAEDISVRPILPRHGLPHLTLVVEHVQPERHVRVSPPVVVVAPSAPVVVRPGHPWAGPGRGWSGRPGWR